MTTKKELESLSPTELAVFCSKVSESPSASSVEADQGRELKHEWATLIASMTPPSSILKEQQEQERKIEIWKRKAVSFLAAVLPAQ
jgi:hypothetical protein